MKIHVDIDGALDGLEHVRTLARDCVVRCGNQTAAGMEAYAKQNRPWTDRTGNARRTMEGFFLCGGDSAMNPDLGKTSQNPSEEQATCYTVGVAGHMPYSVNLELSFAKKYAILWPTVNVLAPEFLRNLAAALLAMHA